MSDTENTTPPAGTEPAETPDAKVEPQGDTGPDWKAEARKWETRAKADHDAAAKWREYESSQKTDFEKQAEELAQLKAEAAQAQAELLRLKIASDKGISGEATKLLKGTTQEELESEAELLLSLIASQSKPKSPNPDANQGQPAPKSLGQLTQADLAGMTDKEIMVAKAEGRLDELLGKTLTR